MNKQIGVLGLGNWGTALANHLALQGHSVLGWCREVEIAEGINKRRTNPIFLSDAKLSNNLAATNQILELSNLDAYLFVIPSHGLREVAAKLNLSKSSLIISAVKGLDKTTLATPLSLLEECLGPNHDYVAISGPSFARDVIASQPVLLVSASKSVKAARNVADLFSSPTFRVFVSSDPIGVEIGAVVKNVVALAAGVCDGLDFGVSTRAGLVTRGLAEMTKLAVKLGAKDRTVFGLAGLGDLVVTATSNLSRNHTVGVRLGKGEKLPKIVETLGSTAEAVTTAPLVMQLAKKARVSMPICEQVVRLIEGVATPKEIANELLNMPVRSEF